MDRELYLTEILLGPSNTYRVNPDSPSQPSGVVWEDRGLGGVGWQGQGSGEVGWEGQGSGGWSGRGRDLGSMDSRGNIPSFILLCLSWQL